MSCINRNYDINFTENARYTRENIGDCIKKLRIYIQLENKNYEIVLSKFQGTLHENSLVISNKFSLNLLKNVENFRKMLKINNTANGSTSHECKNTKINRLLC